MDKHFKIYRISDAKIPVLYDENMNGSYYAALINKYWATLLRDWREWKTSALVPALCVEEATLLQIDDITCRSLFCYDERGRPVIVLTLEQVDSILIDRLNTCATAATIHGSIISFTMKGVDSVEERRQRRETQWRTIEVAGTIIGILTAIVGILRFLSNQ